MGITLSSHWKTPEILTVLTSPSGYTNSFFSKELNLPPDTLLAPSVPSSSGTGFEAHRHTQSQCLYPADPLTTEHSRKHGEGHKTTPTSVFPLLLWPKAFFSWEGKIFLCSEFYLQGNVDLISISFRVIFTHLYHKALLPQQPQRSKTLPPTWMENGCHLPKGLHSQLQEDEAGSLGFVVSGLWKSLFENEMCSADLIK